MTRFKLLAGCLLLALAVPGVGRADPWKDESGHGRAEYRGERHDRRGWTEDDRRDRRAESWEARRGEWRGYDAPRYAPPRIPPGHMPPPGEYRAWFPDRPPGHQPPPQRW